MKIPFSANNLELAFQNEDKLELNEQFQSLKKLYEEKMAAVFGLQTSYAYTKEWSNLTQRSFSLASEYAKFDYKFLNLKKHVKNLELSIHKLDQSLLDRESFLKSTPTIMPTRGWITSYYGPRKNPYSGRMKMHEGIDIGARTNTRIVAPADGVVIFAGVKPGFGKLVEINHGYGIETIFGHARSLSVKSGAKVKRGHEIATVGSSGYSTGPHVHYEIRVNGVPVDPFYFILD